MPAFGTCLGSYKPREDEGYAPSKTPAASDVTARELEAYRMGNRRGWEQCIESLKDFSGDGVVTDDMIAWLEKEKLEDSV